MRKLNELKDANLFWRKIILFVVLFVLAVPITILIGRGFTNRVAGFDSQTFLNQAKLDEELGEPLLQVQQSGEELQEFIGKISNLATTSTSTEFILSEVEWLSTGTSTDDANFQ